MGQTGKAEQLASLLQQLEATLKQQQLWQDQPPSAKALASTQPFCVDTLAFEQWLQFVMLGQFRQILRRDLPLPNQCSIAPMAEQAFASAAQPELVAILQAIDDLLSTH